MSSLLQVPSKRRPSIELAPSLERPVFIITKNLNSSHILSLTEELDKHKIAFQMQQETATLGCDLKQRFFVIVDNQRGEVTLGPQFGSILMNIIGYPRIGRNPKNKYFTRPSQIIAFYQKFKYDRDISERQKTLIRSQYMDVVMQNSGSGSKMGSKIVARSICKYKSPEKDQKRSDSQLKDSLIKDCQKVKLLLMEDKTDQLYSNLCNEILQKMNPKCLIQTVQSISELKRRTLFHTNKLNIYYLINQRYEKEVLENITVGEAIVFINKNEVNVFRRIINEEKIYAVCCESTEIIRILEKVGFLFKMPSQLPEISKIKEPSVIVNGVKENSNIFESFKPEREEKDSQIQKQMSVVQEISKIEAVQSFVSKKVDESEMNVSVLSHISGNNKKIKRLKSALPKPKTPEKPVDPKPENEYYVTSKKENQVPADQKGVLKKKTLKTEDKEIFKSKKSLKFIDEVTSPTLRLKKIRSIQKCAPEAVELAAQESWTMTQNQYLTQTPISGLTFNLQKTAPLKYSKVVSSLDSQSQIHAIFYHEFIPRFHNIVHLIKLNPQGLFAERTTLEYYQPFFSPKEFDRAARKIKQRWRQEQKDIEVFNFLVLTLEEEVQAFEKYLYRKNMSYEEELTDMESTFKATNNSLLGCKGFKINVFMFIEAKGSITDQSIDYGKIKLVKRGLSQCFEEGVDGDVAARLGQKIQEEGTRAKKWGEVSGFDLIHS